MTWKCGGILLGVVLGAAGCQVGAESGAAQQDFEPICAGPLGRPLSLGDLEKLDACCEGGDAHCIASDTVPLELRGFVETCDGGGACVPDSLLKTGGSVPPASCADVTGGDGICLSKCIPLVAENAALLAQADCAGDELCVPCINPLDGQPTGACELTNFATCVGENGGFPVSTCENPVAVIEASALPPCADDAHCVDKAIVDAVDPTVSERLAECANTPGSLCVPDVVINTGGSFALASCASVDNLEGRCASTAIPEVGASADLLPVATCAATERCAPCFDPVDASPTGLCGMSCDAGPVQPARALATCGDGGLGRCVPNANIPLEAQDSLDERNCDDDEVLGDAGENYSCVPNQLLQNGPWLACSGDLPFLGDYVGSCLNTEIMDIGGSGFFDQDVCGQLGQDFECTPCKVDGELTGAPGCDTLYPLLTNDP